MPRRTIARSSEGEEDEECAAEGGGGGRVKSGSPTRGRGVRERVRLREMATMRGRAQPSADDFRARMRVAVICGLGSSFQ